MRNCKTKLLASAAIAALALGTASQARAFDDTDWVWNVDVTKTITEVVDIDVDLDVSGMVTVEALQENIGDVTATATLTDFENNAFAGANGEGGVIEFTDTIVLNVDYDQQGTPGDGTNPVTPSNLPGAVTGGTVITGGEIISGNVDELTSGIEDLTVEITGEVDQAVLDSLALDAYDLPKVENIATAVANNFDLESEVASNVNVGQLNYGDFAVDGGGTQGTPAITQYLSELGATFNSTNNAHLGKAYSAGLAAALGLLVQGEVTAVATVDTTIPGFGNSVLNASVENAATAVGNNINIDLNADTDGDAFLVADLTQFNYANTSATALVDDVLIDGYSGFGDAGFGPCGGCLDEAGDNVGDQIPIISNIATAVGNNISISVTSPDVDGGGDEGGGTP